MAGRELGTPLGLDVQPVDSGRIISGLVDLERDSEVTPGRLPELNEHTDWPICESSGNPMDGLAKSWFWFTQVT